MESNFLNIDGVAERLRVSRDTAYRLAASGTLRGTKIGRSWRFSPKEIESYLQRQTAGETEIISQCDDASIYWQLSPDFVLCVDLSEGAVTNGNPAATGFFGSEPPAVGRRLRTLHVDSEASAVDAWIEALRRGEEVAGEGVVISGNGSRIQTSVRARAVGHGSVRTQALFFYRDVTQQKLRESEAQLLVGSELAFAAGAPSDGVVVATSDGRLIHCNDRARKLIPVLPQPGERISCGDYDEFFLTDGKTPLPGENLPVRRALLGESTEQIEVVRRMPGDAESTWLRMRAFPLRDATGGVSGAVCIFQDVTDAKRQESRLLCTEFSVRRCPDAIFWIDVEGAIVYANDAACRSLGYEPQELSKLRISDFALERDDRTYAELLNRLRESGTLQFDGRHRSRQGRIFPVEVSANLVEYDGKEIVCAYARDVSSRRGVERELRESEERFRRAIAGSRDGLWDWDIRTGAVWYSPRYLEQLGLDPKAELAPVLQSWKDRIHPDDLEAVDRAVRAHLEGNAPYDIEYRLRTETGEFRWFRVRGQAFWDEHGLPERMSGSTTDITEQRRRESASEARKRGMLLLIDKAPAAIAMFDRDLRYVAHSRAWTQSYGLADESLVGKRHYEVFPEMPERWKAAHRDCLDGAVRCGSDDPFFLADGTPIRVEWEIHPWFEDDERVGGIIMFTVTRPAPFPHRDILREASDASPCDRPQDVLVSA